MRDVTSDPKFKPANAVPFSFNEGDPVRKVSGDYTFAGIVTCCFRKRSGAPRYVVENEEGIVHIFNALQLILDESEWPPSGRPLSHEPDHG